MCFEVVTNDHVTVRRTNKVKQDAGFCHLHIAHRMQLDTAFLGSFYRARAVGACLHCRTCFQRTVSRNFNGGLNRSLPRGRYSELP